MIVKDLVFIHIPKNMGTSIEMILLNNDYADNYKRFQKEFRKTCNYNYSKTKKFRDGEFPSLHHLPISYYRENHNYLTAFAVVRNPYSRTESLYKFYCDKYKYINFADFVTELTTNKNFYNRHMLLPQYKFVDDTVQIFKMENKKKIFDFLSDRGYKCKIHTNKSQNYEINWTKQLINKINDYYHEDFVKFNYPKL